MDAPLFSPYSKILRKYLLTTYIWYGSQSDPSHSRSRKILNYADTLLSEKVYMNKLNCISCQGL